jgi:uncharacterized protein YijF (DUF1287 family)
MDVATPSTPRILAGSLLVLLAGCAPGRESTGAPGPVPRPPPEAEPRPGAPHPGGGAAAPVAAAPASEPERSLGVADRGIWSDLDDQVQLALPTSLAPGRVEGVIAADESVLVLYVDGWPTKPYPLGGDTTLVIGARALPLRPGDAAELEPLLGPANLRQLDPGQAPSPGDRDGDHLPDPLDILIGAKKTAIQAGAYGGGYLRLAYPMGDVPRDLGVCTDVVIRALRNAGVDLQAELQRDIRRHRAAYPMVKGRGDPNIDHRRVKTLLPWFRRHADARAAALDDPKDPLRPGDIVFMDTFPSWAGPDHIGILSDVLGPSGRPLVINAWTHGFVTQEMDLLGWVPVTHRFRLRPD